MTEQSGSYGRYSVACRGMRDGKNGPVICKGWGRWGTPGEKCPTCHQTVAVMQEVVVVPVGSVATEEALDD